MTRQERIEAAMRVGARRAQEVLARSAVRTERRRRAVSRAEAIRSTQSVPLTAPPVVTPEFMHAAGPPGKGYLVAEGDSWFDYPGTDILSELRDRCGWEVRSVARKGDRVEDMAYQGDQLDDLVEEIKELLRHDIVPRAVLLSGGGNDLVVEKFGTLLNHFDSPERGLNHDIVKGLMDRIGDAYTTLFQAVTNVCTGAMGYPLAIVIHGYGHAVPDGRGFPSWFPIVGPWLEPGFINKGYGATTLEARKLLVRDVITALNQKLQDVAGLFGNVVYVDLRAILSDDLTGNHYRQDWDNELHPTDDAFGRIADAIDVRIWP
jgi:hypothetical protein